MRHYVTRESTSRSARRGSTRSTPPERPDKSAKRPRPLHYGIEAFCKTRINNLSEASMYSST